MKKHIPYFKKYISDWGNPQPFYSVSDENITPNLTPKEYDILSPYYQYF